MDNDSAVKGEMEAKTCPECGHSFLGGGGCQNPHCEDYVGSAAHVSDVIEDLLTSNELYEGRTWGGWRFSARECRLEFAGKHGETFKVDLSAVLGNREAMLGVLADALDMRYMRSVDLGDLLIAVGDCGLGFNLARAFAVKGD